ncbi:unnamed protein product [Kluyveromyces dobzhanskii CBS 2104]|uniref:Chromatin modification-related protein n=1 Tax=Kluyveromyces dobzhanskii CBS 2104 TaxID=1427455 RepID=A0A0A8LBE6_9SACH|nr:unnamed protein product [Kluyveromyces dobzhanskii CBS 2104]
MSAPANLFPGLNDISDVLEEVPLEVSRYMTLLYEIDAKCVNIVPELNKCIQGFLSGKDVPDESKVSLRVINQWFQELIPSLEEKMHVSSIADDTLERLTDRLELAYEVAIANQEIPEKLRLGNDNHPAMHLHRELMAKVESNAVTKSQQALKSESRREAMAAKKTTGGAAAPVGNGAGTGAAASAAAVSTAGSSSTSGLGNATRAGASASSTSALKHSTAPSHHSGNAHTNSHNSALAAAGIKHNHVHNQNVNDNGQAHRDEEQPTNAKKRRNNNGTTTTTVSNAGINSPAANNAPAQRRNKKRVGVTTTTATTTNTGATIPITGTHASSKYQNRPKTNEYGEALYCYCNQVAYGEMVGCDGEECQLEWFHLPCIGLETLPKGKWYCDDCLKKI